jgi:hypothetical protein
MYSGRSLAMFLRAILLPSSGSKKAKQWTTKNMFFVEFLYFINLVINANAMSQKKCSCSFSYPVAVLRHMLKNAYIARASVT